RHAVDLEVEQAGIGGRREALLDLEEAALPRVRNGADEHVVLGDGDSREAGAGAGVGGRPVARAGDRAVVIAQRGAGAGELTDGMVRVRVDCYRSRRAAVPRVGGSRRAVDPEVELAGVRGRGKALPNLDRARVARVGDRAD